MTANDEVSLTRHREFIHALNAEVEADNALNRLYAESPLTLVMISKQEQRVQEIRRRRRKAEFNAYGFILGQDSYP